MAKLLRIASAPGVAVYAQLLRWPARRWLVGVGAACVAALMMGIPTAVIRTSLFIRMTPVTWWAYPIWGASAVMLGLVAATYVQVREPSGSGGGPAVGGGLLSAFAIGCPVCNKIIVALLGIGGALNYWAPLQPFLGLASVALLLTTLSIRLRGEERCRLPRPSS